MSRVSCVHLVAFGRIMLTYLFILYFASGNFISWISFMCCCRCYFFFFLLFENFLGSIFNLPQCHFQSTKWIYLFTVSFFFFLSNSFIFWLGVAKWYILLLLLFLFKFVNNVDDVRLPKLAESRSNPWNAYKSFEGKKKKKRSNIRKAKWKRKKNKNKITEPHAQYNIYLLTMSCNSFSFVLLPLCFSCSFRYF